MNKFFTSCKPGITSEGKSQSLPLRQLKIVWDNLHISDSCSQTEHDLGPKCSFFATHSRGWRQSWRIFDTTGVFDTVFSAVFGSPGIGSLLHRSEFWGRLFHGVTLYGACPGLAPQEEETKNDGRIEQRCNNTCVKIHDMILCYIYIYYYIIYIIFIIVYLIFIYSIFYIRVKGIKA